MNSGLRVRLLLIGLALALGGCSLLSFVYGRLDTIAEVYADRWFDFDREQSRRFKALVRERLAQNRRDELPLFSAYLDDARQLIEGQPTPAAIDSFLDRGRGLFEQTLRRSLPLMSETLAGLTPAQVEHFAGELADNNREYVEEELDADPEERQAERRKELTREIESWTGKLAPAQRAILDGLVTQVPDGARAWYEHRRTRQRGLLELLRARAPAASHADYIESWWLGDRHLEPAHAAQLERNRATTVVALAELIATLTPKQRERTAARLRSIAAELDALHTQDGDKR